MINVIAMADLLEGEYRTAFQKIDMYATVNGVDQYEERILNIYDMLTEAQNRQDDVEKIIGSDIEDFCKIYFKTEKTEYSWLEKIGKMKGTLILWIAFLVIDILFEIEDYHNIFKIKSNMFPILLGFGVAIVSFVISKLVFTPIIFKKKKISPVSMSFCIMGLFIGSIVVGITFFGHIEIMVHTWIMLSIIVALLLLYTIICWKLKKNGIKFDEETNADKELKKSFQEEIDMKATIKMIAPIMEKRYERIRRRKAKRGLDYTMEDFQALIHKESKPSVIFDKFTILIIAIIVAVPVVKSFLAGDYLLGLILVVTVGVVEYVLYRTLIKAITESIRNSSICQIKIVDECVSRGITLAEYNVEENTDDEINENLLGINS